MDPCWLFFFALLYMKYFVAVVAVDFNNEI